MGDFNLMEAAAELTAESGTEVEATQVESTEGQAETPPDETVEKPELSTQEILKQVGEEKADFNPAVIEELNKLGFVRNGVEFKINSPEQVKELIQKGFDYTEKSMARENEYKLKQEEFAQKENVYKEKDAFFAQKEQEIQQTVHVNNLVGEMLKEFQQQDPDLFAYLDQKFREKEDVFNRSVPFKAEFEGKFKQLNERFEQLEKDKQEGVHSQIRQTWENGLQEVQTNFASKLKTLGVVPNWEKVKEVWMADATGKLDVESALDAVYGKEIRKASESYRKLLETKNKTQSKMINRSGIGNAHGKGETVKASVMGDYESILRSAVNQI